MRTLTAALAVVVLIVVAPGVALGHSGGTDSNGGHYCRTNCAKWGYAQNEYHYHGGSGGNSGGSTGGGSTSGGTSESTESSSFVAPRDTTPPARPTVSSPTIEGRTVRVQVEGERGARLTVESDEGDRLYDRTLKGSDVSFDMPSDGTWRLRFALTDSAGNESPSSELRVSVDTAPPEQTTVELVGGSADQPMTVVAFRLAESLSWVLEFEGATPWRADGRDLGSVTENAPLAPGDYTVTLTLTDAADNVTTQEATYTVDVPPPSAFGVTVDGKATESERTVRIAGPPLGSATVEVVGQTHQLDLDENGSAELDLELPDGEHDLVISGEDYIGRPTPEQDAVAILVDTEPPVISLVEGPGGWMIELEDGATATLASAAMGTIAVASGQLPADLQPGEHTLTLVAFDLAGNRTAIEAVVRIAGPNDLLLAVGLLMALTNGALGSVAVVSLLVSARTKRRR
jgi:hypothetical protein